MSTSVKFTPGQKIYSAYVLFNITTGRAEESLIEATFLRYAFYLGSDVRIYDCFIRNSSGRETASSTREWKPTKFDAWNERLIHFQEQITSARQNLEHLLRKEEQILAEIENLNENERSA